MDAFTLQHAAFQRGQRRIFHELSFTIPSGQFIGLLGPNGTGKSTLLKCLAGMLPLSAGHITVLAEPLHKLKPRNIAKLVTYMPQTTILDTNFTVEQVVQMGRYPHKGRFASWDARDKEAVHDALTLTETLHLKDRFVPSLSGGERQLVYLAKAIAQNTPIILLDEPTSDLDIHHQIIVTRIIHMLVDTGKTVIAALHDINYATRECTQCLVVRDGRIITFGDNDAVMQHKHFEAAFDVKAHIFNEQFTNKKQMIPYEVTYG